MTLLCVNISSLRLRDVNRRSLYVALTLLGWTFWAQWWPRPGYPPRPFLTAGVRAERPNFFKGEW